MRWRTLEDSALLRKAVDAAEVKRERYEMAHFRG